MISIKIEAAETLHKRALLAEQKTKDAKEEMDQLKAHARSARIAAELAAQKEERENTRLDEIKTEERRVKAIEKKAVAAVREMELNKQTSRKLMDERAEEWQRRYDMLHKTNEDTKKAIHDHYEQERRLQTEKDRARQARLTIKDKAQENLGLASNAVSH